MINFDKKCVIIIFFQFIKLEYELSVEWFKSNSIIKTKDVLVLFFLLWLHLYC